MRDPWDNPAQRHIMRELQRQQNDPAYRHLIREVERQQNDPARRYLMEAEERRLRDPAARLIDSVGFRTRLEERLLAQMSTPGLFDQWSLFERAREANSSVTNILNDLRSRVSAVEQLHAVSPGWRSEVEEVCKFHSLPDAQIESAVGAYLSRIKERCWRSTHSPACIGVISGVF